MQGIFDNLYDLFGLADNRQTYNVDMLSIKYSDRTKMEFDLYYDGNSGSNQA